MPSRNVFAYVREPARTIGGFVDAIGLERFAVYIFDWRTGRPSHGDEDAGADQWIISQNGNAYEDGLGSSTNSSHWSELTQANRDVLRTLLQPGMTLLSTRTG
jgi:hypothetical protein